MAQVEFYMNTQDKIDFVNYVISVGFSLVPSIHYPQKKYHVINKTEDYLPYSKQHMTFSLIHKTYNSCPLELRPIEKNGKKLFYIMPKNGGPVIEFYHHFDRKINNKQHIGAASLSYYSNYCN